MRVSFARILLSATSILLACYFGPPPANPYAVPRQVFFDSVRTVVVTSASVVGEIAIADSILTYFETHIEKGLRDAGLSVVPATDYATIWQRITDETGGFFDPYTGERDEQTFQIAVERLQNELVEQFDPDALLYPEIWEVDAPFSGGHASWSGTTQTVRGSGGYSGDVRAATLYVVIQDFAGNELYAQEAGIQVVEYMLRGQLTRLTAERLFSDSTSIPNAVSRVLDPLIEGRPAVTPEF